MDNRPHFAAAQQTVTIGGIADMRSIIAAVLSAPYPQRYRPACAACHYSVGRACVHRNCARAPSCRDTALFRPTRLPPHGITRADASALRDQYCAVATGG